MFYSYCFRKLVTWEQPEIFVKFSKGFLKSQLVSGIVFYLVFWHLEISRNWYLFFYWSVDTSTPSVCSQVPDSVTSFSRRTCWRWRRRSRYRVIFSNACTRFWWRTSSPKRLRSSWKRLKWWVAYAVWRCLTDTSCRRVLDVRSRRHEG